MPISHQAQVAEINGLRAIAVLAVVLFHSFPELVPGGFIGVDIFFVISGYVISRSYLEQLSGGTRRLGDFYIARIRRLAPAYFTLLFVCTLFAWLLFEPPLLKQFGTSLAAQSIYAQNFTFWLQGDYFEKAITKPLLHTWSLAVEEQFYLCFFLLAWLWKTGTATRTLVILTVVVCSLLLGYLLYPLSPKTAFFLLPTRAWELLLGVLAFQVIQGGIIPRPLPWKGALFTLAMTCMLLSCLLFPENSRFPGLHAFLACGSTAVLILLFESNPGSTYRILNTRWTQYLGQVSYSLYLWHWPVIVMLSTYLGGRPGIPLTLVAVALSVALAAASYRYIEQPVRQSRFLESRRSLLGGFLGAAIAVACGGLWLYESKGAVSRFEEPVRSLYLAAQERTPRRCPLITRVQNPGNEICLLNGVGGPGGLLILGDSHADALDQMLAGLGEGMQLPVYLSVRSCDFHRYRTPGHCNTPAFHRILQQARSKGITTILATSMWHPDGYTAADFRAPLADVVQAGLSIYFSEVVPHSELFDPAVRAAQIRRGQSDFPPGLTLDEYRQQVALQRSIFAELQQAHPERVRILRPSDYLCGERYCDFSSKGVPNYSDDSHLTREGTRRIRPMYEQMFKRLAAMRTRH